MKSEKNMELPEFYREILSPKEKLNVKIKTLLDKIALQLNSADEVFRVSEDLYHRNRTLLGLLPEDFDEVLMRNGDDYPPSQRLNNIANRWYNEKEDVSKRIPGSIIKDYFTQFYTYKAVYKKIKARENSQAKEQKLA